MKELRIKFDFSHGPIWKNKFDPVTGAWSTGIAAIDNDKILNSLNDQVQQEYSSFYSFDKDGRFIFDENAFDQKREHLASSIKEIISRADELNDGSFEIVDEETEKLLNAV